MPKNEHNPTHHQRLLYSGHATNKNPLETKPRHKLQPLHRFNPPTPGRTPKQQQNKLSGNHSHPTKRNRRPKKGNRHLQRNPN